MRLSLALPYDMVYASIMKRHLRQYPEDGLKEFCLVELGYDSSRVVIMQGAAVLASKAKTVIFAGNFPKRNDVAQMKAAGTVRMTNS